MQIALTDATGVVTASNLGPVDGTISIADRKHFLGTRDSAGDSLLIGTPVIGRVSGQWSVQFVRKLFRADGAFDGVIVASLDPRFLSRFSKPLDIGRGMLLLAGQDGIVRAASPISAMPLATDLQSLGLTMPFSGQAFGTLVTREAQDGVERITSWRRIDGLGLVVMVGMSRGDALAVFYMNTRIGLLLGLGMTAVALLVAFALIRNRRDTMQSQAILEGAVENISQGLLVVDPQRRIAVLNARAIELLGLPAHLARRGVAFDDILAWQLSSGEFDGGATAKVRSLAESGGFASDADFYHRTRPNGVVLELRSKVLETGLAVRTITDITEQQHHETELATARDAAMAAAKARSAFLATMSHEIRTPLNGVIGIASLLEDMELGEAQRAHVRLIRRSSDHLLTLINDVLDFSRLDAGRIELERIVFDPLALVQDAADLFLALAAMKGLHLSTDTSKGVPPLLIGDPGRLRQVLLNLVGNAVKFTEQGWVRIGLAVEPVDDALGVDRVRLCLSVADSGIGMAPEAVAGMFAEFTQMDGSISRRYGGSGLGLAICQRLVGLMGGEITVDTREGEGSCFRFATILERAAPVETLPEPELLAGPAQDPALDMATRHALLVEDNKINQLVARHILERLGYGVTIAGNGLEALAALDRGAFDLVVMDAMMPEMDGLTATRHIRGGEATDQRMLILGLTAGSRTEDLDACIEAGMDAVTTKPVILERMRAAIAEAAANNRQGRIAQVADGTANGSATEAASGFQTLSCEARQGGLSSRWAELAGDVGTELADQIARDFIEDATARIATLHEASRQGDHQTLRQMAHALAGMGRNVGADAMAATATALEHGSEGLSEAALSHSVAVLKSDLRLAVNDLTASLASA